jgi:hypothetical protein
VRSFAKAEVYASSFEAPPTFAMYPLAVSLSRGFAQNFFHSAEAHNTTPRMERRWKQGVTAMQSGRTATRGFGESAVKHTLAL